MSKLSENVSAAFKECNGLRNEVERLSSENDELRAVLAQESGPDQLAALREELAERKRKHLRSCQIAIGKSQLAKERHSELIKFDEGMRSMASMLGAGGYNAVTLAADELVAKVKWGIDNMVSVQEQRLADAERQNAELLQALNEVHYLVAQHKVWNGMGWTHTGLRAAVQERVLDIIRAALTKPN